MRRESFIECKIGDFGKLLDQHSRTSQIDAVSAVRLNLQPSLVDHEDKDLIGDMFAAGKAKPILRKTPPLVAVAILLAPSLGRIDQGSRRQ